MSGNGASRKGARGRDPGDGRRAASAGSLVMPEPHVGAVRLRIQRPLVERMKADLRRPHPFAAERVGFLSVAVGRGERDELLILGVEYRAVAEEHYVQDSQVGVRIGVGAIREALERIRVSGHGLFHVHLHDHPGLPNFSGTDRREQPRLVEGFRRVGRHVPHGMMVLSANSASAWVWLPGEDAPVLPEQITFVGYPLTIIGPRVQRHKLPAAGQQDTDRFDRQSFLGPDSQPRIERVRIGVVGLGGGGSHIVQQAAHVGFRRMRGFDDDTVDETNLNRLVGARADDVENATAKTEVARRLVDGLLSGADVMLYKGRWQDNPESLRTCDLVIGCVDSFAERRELEMACRRYLIPYVDIGMDVHQVGDDPPRMAGQVILSMPEGPCMFCLGFLTEDRLAKEAAAYGAAGDRPQVVWPNGVLASTAIGVIVDLVTGWTRQRDRLVYLSYDGNTGEVTPHARLRFLQSRTCAHYTASDIGDPILRRLSI